MVSTQVFQNDKNKERSQKGTRIIFLCDLTNMSFIIMQEWLFQFNFTPPSNFKLLDLQETFFSSTSRWWNLEWYVHSERGVGYKIACSGGCCYYWGIWLVAGSRKTFFALILSTGSSFFVGNKLKAQETLSSEINLS